MYYDRAVRRVAIVAGVLLTLGAPRVVWAQTPARRVVIVAEPSVRASADGLAAALGELVAPYRAVVLVQAPDVAPDVDAAVTLTLARAPRGFTVVVAQTRIASSPLRSSALALRVLTAIRGTLASAPEDPLDAPLPEEVVTAERTPHRQERASDAVHPQAETAPRSVRTRVRAHPSTIAVEAAGALWSPVGAGSFYGASLRFSGRVGGSARSAAVLGAGLMVLGSRALVLSGASEHVAQVPILLDAAWATRVGPLTASIGGTFAALVTTVGSQRESSTLAFGAGAMLEVGARLGATVAVVARARALCIAHTTVLRGEDTAVGSIGPFFGGAELALRLSL